MVKMICLKSVEDSGFSRGRQPLRLDANLLFDQFLRDEEILTRGTGHLSLAPPPLDPPLEMTMKDNEISATGVLKETVLSVWAWEPTCISNRTLK